MTVRVSTSITRPGWLADVEAVALVPNLDGTITVRLENKGDCRGAVNKVDLVKFNRLDVQEVVNEANKMRENEDALAAFKEYPIGAISAIRAMTKCDLATANRIVVALLKGA